MCMQTAEKQLPFNMRNLVAHRNRETSAVHDCRMDMLNMSNWECDAQIATTPTKGCRLDVRRHGEMPPLHPRRADSQAKCPDKPLNSPPTERAAADGFTF